MIRLFALGLILSSTSVFGQFPKNGVSIPGKVTTLGQAVAGDTALKVVYKNQLAGKQGPALFLNGRLVSHSTSAMTNLRPERIDSLNMVEGVVRIDGVEYDGKLYVKTKDSYVPRIVSLTELKKKYAGSTSEPVIFMIDDEFVKRNYDTYTIDKDAVSSIVIDTIKNSEAVSTIAVIKLITKKPGGIRIRGNELGMNTTN